MYKVWVALVTDGLFYIPTLLRNTEIDKGRQSLMGKKVSLPRSNVVGFGASENSFKSLRFDCPLLFSDNRKEKAEEAAQGSGFTLLHQAAFNNADYTFVEDLIRFGAWRRSFQMNLPILIIGNLERSILTERFAPGTMRSLEREGYVTAQDIARNRGYDQLALLLEPRIHHPIPREILEKLELRVHDVMRTVVGTSVRATLVFPLIKKRIHMTESSQISKYGIRLPQLCVMTEMNVSKPSLWVPIPGMYGVSNSVIQLR